jgi:hypothetical protein
MKITMSGGRLLAPATGLSAALAAPIHTIVMADIQ